MVILSRSTQGPRWETLLRQKKLKGLELKESLERDNIITKSDSEESQTDVGIID